MMNVTKACIVLFILPLIIFFPACDDCTVNPDLVSDLLAPSADIIAGEPVDWDYVVESVNDGQDCDILEAAASIGNIVIDFFTNPSDTNGDIVLNEQDNVNSLRAGQTQTINKSIDVFDTEGIYMLMVNADQTDVVTERNEDNNTDNANVDTRASFYPDDFANASDAFKAKLSQAAAIVVVGRHLTVGGVVVYSYQGKPIYYAQ